MFLNFKLTVFRLTALLPLTRVYSFHHGAWSVLAKNRRYSEESYRNSITKMNKRKFKFNIEYFNHRKKDYLNKTITVKIVKDKRKKNSAETK